MNKKGEGGDFIILIFFMIVLCAALIPPVEGEWFNQKYLHDACKEITGNEDAHYEDVNGRLLACRIPMDGEYKLIIYGDSND